MKRLFALVVAMALIVAACGGQTDAEKVQEAADACQAGETDGDLNLYNWTDYIPTGSLAEEFEVDDLLAKFEAEYGVNTTLTFFASNEDLIAQINAGSSYDAIVPSDSFVSDMIDAGLLVELNKAAIPNFANVDQQFADPPYDPGNAHSAPYQWGTTGIGYKYGTIDDEDGVSWAVLFDPATAAPNAGFISLLDDTRETLGSALKYLGYSLNTTSEAEVDEAAQLIADAKAHVAAFNSTSYWGLLTDGEFDVSQGWSGDFLAEFDRITEYDEDGEITYSGYDDFGYAVPIEGSAGWVDTMAVPTTAAHPCTGQTFINFMLDAENGGTLTNFNYYASPNAAAKAHIYEEILEDPSIYPPPAVMANLEFFEPLGDFTNYYGDAYTKAKG